MEVEDTTLQAVGDLTNLWGTKPLRAEGVSLVVDLAGRGGDLPPSEEREMLLAEMRTRKVDKPNEVLGSTNTALVMVSATIPPGAQRGDPLDIEVRVPPRGSVQSLAGGWLMQTRLREYARLNKRLATGHLMAIAQGDVLIDAFVEGEDDEVSLIRGRVLGGGRVVKDRSLGLTLRDENLSVQTSTRVGKAINERFNVHDHGTRKGVAVPKRDDFVEVVVHPRYRDNLVRYFRVIQAIAVREADSGLVMRMESLKKRLAHAPSAAKAALELEAIGADAVGVLRGALTSHDPEVRFYAAEALAYMNEPAAAPILAMAAKTEPAFRWRSLTALSAMEDGKAYEELEELLSVESAETRYGAFRSIRAMNANEPMVAGEHLGEKIYYHVLDSAGPPMVHVALSHRPEIVLFGNEHHLQHPVVVFAGKEIVIRSADDGGLTVTRVTAGEDDRHLTTSTNLDEVIRGVVELGGDYSDVVQLLRDLKVNHSLLARLEFGALPQVGRTYHRAKKGASDGKPPWNMDSSSETASLTDGVGSESSGELPEATQLEVERLLSGQADLADAPEPSTGENLAPIVDASTARNSGDGAASRR